MPALEITNISKQDPWFLPARVELSATRGRPSVTVSKVAVRALVVPAEQ